MSLWKSTLTLEQLNARHRLTIHVPLGIQYTKIGEDFLEATMPVDPRTYQPFGLLHGGASVVLAESLGSIASYLVVSPGEAPGSYHCLGIEINASHVSGVREGKVVGRATPIRLGHTLHVWEIQIRHDGTQRLVSQARLTVLVKKISPAS